MRSKEIKRQSFDRGDPDPLSDARNRCRVSTTLLLLLLARGFISINSFFIRGSCEKGLLANGFQPLRIFAGIHMCQTWLPCPSSSPGRDWFGWSGLSCLFHNLLSSPCPLLTLLIRFLQTFNVNKIGLMDRILSTWSSLSFSLLFLLLLGSLSYSINW